MNRIAYIFLGILLCLVVVAGCSSEGSDTQPTEEADATVVAELEANAEEEAEATTQDDGEEPEAEGTEEMSDEGSDVSNTEANVKLGDYQVYLGGEMLETEDKIIIDGESNLLPGARVVGEISVGEDTYFADTTEIVQEDGSFYMELAHHSLNEETNIVVKFHFDSPQDDGIKRHYGERGQNLEGPYVYQHKRKAGGRSPQDIYKKAEVTATFRAGEEMAIREFKEPEWYPIPEDLGSPRVWIEVDEITNDKEYFYVHGRSNLIEGSKIKGSYRYNRDETLVKPDGSFGLKIDYEYRENTPFIIEFNPNNLQWNIVEETYGKEGQKLVGDLVVVNKYNNKQSIEKRVELQSTEINAPDNVELNIDGTEVTMLVPDHLLFDFDQFDIKEEAKATLVEISKTLQSFKNSVNVAIHGHTDNVGDQQYNLDLSKKRAESVKAFLLEQGAMENVNFSTEGYGETKPIASNDDEAGQAKNRRVEIVINLREQ